MPPGADATAEIAPTSVRPSTRTFTRLAVGAVIEAGLELFARARAWEETQARIVPEPAGQTVQPETQELLLRYAVVGLIFDVERRIRTELLSIRIDPTTGAVGLVLLPARLVVGSWFFKPVRRRINNLAAWLESEFWRLVDVGRSEDVISRAMARHVTADSIDSLIRYLAAQPEVRDLVHEQSTGMAQEVVAGLRRRTATADSGVERLVRAIFQRNGAGGQTADTANGQNRLASGNEG